MIIDHITLGVADYERSKNFYRAALAPLGITLMAEIDGWAGFGRAPKPEFWFGRSDEPPGPIHIAFLAADREQVRAFYKAAMAAGGKDNGPPGIRTIYHSNYYGAFVFDPDGHNVEAVCHKPE
jgi:catechol 2,3-dioxygenase-like lactoylglutathione lyase family enzyme